MPLLLNKGQHWRNALTEAAIIVAVATTLSLGYTAITGKGMFGAGARPASLPPPVASESTFLTFGEAQILHRTHGALFVDSRTPQAFDLGHIKGAVNVPLKDIRGDHPALAGLRRDHLLVTYCDGEDCHSSIELAKRLYESGFSNVKVFFGGWNEWVSHEQPTEP